MLLKSKCYRNIPFGFIFSIFLCYSLGCKKDEIWPEPDFILQYENAQGTYSKISHYRSGSSEEYQLLPATSRTYVIDHQSDSIRIKYTSMLFDRSGKPVIYVTIGKFFHRSQLDSLPSGEFVPKNADDFCNIFKKGMVNIMSLQSSDNRKEGLDIKLQDSTSYIFQDDPQSNLYLTIPAYLDSANYFEIIDAKSEVDFRSLSDLSIISSNSYSAIMVTIKFKCKLYDIAEPHPTIELINGTFQGVFSDRP